jgi:cytochrome c oxidase subunit 2
VNHGYGLYDPENTLVAQVQAMPGYVNRLRIRLEKPGIYNVFCLEYCGLTHSIMRTSLEVK